MSREDICKELGETDAKRLDIRLNYMRRFMTEIKDYREDILNIECYIRYGDALYSKTKRFDHYPNESKEHS